MARICEGKMSLTGYLAVGERESREIVKEIDNNTFCKVLDFYEAALSECLPVLFDTDKFPRREFPRKEVKAIINKKAKEILGVTPPASRNAALVVCEAIWAILAVSRMSYEDNYKPPKPPFIWVEWFTYPVYLVEGVKKKDVIEGNVLWLLPEWFYDELYSIVKRAAIRAVDLLFDGLVKEGKAEDRFRCAFKCEVLSRVGFGFRYYSKKASEEYELYVHDECEKVLNEV